MRVMKKLILLSVLLILGACATKAPMPVVNQLDLNRFMGDWYVVAHIPVWLEAEAFNAVESYTLRDDGRTVDTTFTFNKGGFDGPLKTYHPTGFIKPNTGNAHWGMRFVWPLKSDYRVVYVSDDYEITIIARKKRDFAWIMARQPTIAPATLNALTNQLARLGYDTKRLRQVPQQPLGQRNPG